MKRRLQLFILIFSFSFILSFSQKNENLLLNKITIKKTFEKIVIDGVLTEETRKNSKKANSFWRKFPTYGDLAKSNIEVQLTFDNQNVHFTIRVEDEGKRVVKTLKRDF